MYLAGWYLYLNKICDNKLEFKWRTSRGISKRASIIENVNTQNVRFLISSLSLLPSISSHFFSLSFTFPPPIFSSNSSSSSNPSLPSSPHPSLYPFFSHSLRPSHFSSVPPSRLPCFPLLLSPFPHPLPPYPDLPRPSPGSASAPLLAIISHKGRGRGSSRGIDHREILKWRWRQEAF